MADKNYFKALSIMKISEHCYAIQGLYFILPWSVNSGFIVGKKRTLIIDTGCNNLSAQTIYGYAKCANPKNEIIVLNTEKHLDHIGGNSFFRSKNIDIYGHSLLERNNNEFEILSEYFNTQIENNKRKKSNEERIMFADCNIENPNIKIKEEMIIDLGEITAEIMFTPGHTETNISRVYTRGQSFIFRRCNR